MPALYHTTCTKHENCAFETEDIARSCDELYCTFILPHAQYMRMNSPRMNTW